MTIRKPRDLRLVRHAQDLVRLGELLEFDPDCLTYSPTRSVSISSNTIVRGNCDPFATVFSTSINRDASPPDATRASSLPPQRLLKSKTLWSILLSGGFDTIVHLHLKLRSCRSLLHAPFQLPAQTSSPPSLVLCVTCARAPDSVRRGEALRFQLSLTLIRSLDLSQTIFRSSPDVQ